MIWRSPFPESPAASWAVGGRTSLWGRETWFPSSEHRKRKLGRRCTIIWDWMGNWRPEAEEQQQQQTACLKRSLDVARRLTAPGLDRDPESFAPPGLDRELNESSSTKGTASDLGISELQNSVTASGRTIPVEDARSVNRHSQTRSGGAGERFSPAESSSRLYLTLKQQQQQLVAIWHDGWS